MRRLLRTIFWLLLLAVVSAVVAAWFYVRAASPRLDGEVQLAGLRAKVQIDRDEHGIPTIKAESLDDAMFALGVVHAQDRLWQLETHRRIGSGRLAEAFGEPAVESDKFLRVLGVKRVAEQQWQRVKGEAREVLEAYTAGLNAAMAQQTKARPPEMMILGLPLEPWTPADSLAWATMMAWDLGGNFNAELLRLRLALKLPAQRIHELTPPYPGDVPLVATDFVAKYREMKIEPTATSTSSISSPIDAPFDATFGPLLDRVLSAASSLGVQSGVEGTGSNNWVLAGSRSTTDHPLLANDPHLKLTTPALWYFVRIDVPGLKLAGATMPGLPMIVHGQNENIAWGFTNTAPDVQDLYLERFDATDPTRVDTPDGPQPLTSVDEVIRIKGKPDLRITARASRHGPLISDAGTGADVLATKDRPAYALALRWAAIEPDTESTVTAGLEMMRAKSVDDFVRATRGWTAPMQNMLVAERAGRIGYVAPGRVPVRSADNDLKGWVPAPGWEARYDWTGWIDPDATPREFDPPRGWIATANQRIHAADYPHYLTSEWAAPFRQQRVEQMLEAKPKHSIDDLRTMHADEKSLAADKLFPFLKKARSDHALTAAAQAELRDFDGTMAADRAAPAIYWAWLRHLTQGILADELGQQLFDRTLANRQFRDAIEGILARDDAWWCDDKSTPAPETCVVQTDAAFTRALDELSTRYGKDVSAWRWGRIHEARSEHRPFSRVKFLARWFEVRTPVGGDTFTLNAMRVNYTAHAVTGDRYGTDHGPSMRALYDLADPRQSRVMHSSGQSGLPWSDRYRDFADRWAKVEYVPLWPQAEPRHRLTLRPPG